MHMKLLAYLEGLNIAEFQEASFNITPEIELTIKIVDRNQALPPSQGSWVDFLARTILAGLQAYSRDKLEELDITTCCVIQSQGYRFDLSFKAVKPTPPLIETPSVPTLPGAVNAPATTPGQRIVPNSTNPHADRFSNSQAVRRDQFKRNNR